MARLIKTEKEFEDWDSEIEPDVDIASELLLSFNRRRLLDDFDTMIMLSRFGV